MVCGQRSAKGHPTGGVIKSGSILQWKQAAGACSAGPGAELLSAMPRYMDGDRKFPHCFPIAVLTTLPYRNT